MDDLSRFVDAQAPVWDRVRAELAAGSKRSHWMWFVFPQLDGLGSSSMARRYALKDLAEARAYLAHPVLGPRLREGVALLLAQPHGDARRIMGSPDDLKLRSCLTLFARVEPEPFTAALAKFYGGVPDPRTEAML